MAWTGSIALSDGTRLGDITISDKCSKLPIIAQNPTSLHFLSIIETSCIPLYLAIGLPYPVYTTDFHVESWFANVLLSQDVSRPADGWWESATPESPLGVLMAIEEATTKKHDARPRMTEVLFYASHEDRVRIRSPTSPLSSIEAKRRPTLSLYAIGLSSDLLYQAQETEPTPPNSPASVSAAAEARFLSSAFLTAEEVVNEPPIRKRLSAIDVFDEASERRKRARRKGGQGVAAAAAPKTETSQVTSLRHRCSESTGHSVPLQTRPLSRSPSVASSRPTTSAAVGTKRSALSHTENVTTISSGRDIEAKNKDLISRIVMAGMRLYGLSQSRKRKSRPTTPTVEIDPEDIENERRNDEEYKLVYHQVFKGTCFAFRSGITCQNLQLFSNAVREVVDKLLEIFCDDRLSQGVASTGTSDEVTPGGRKAFGSAVKGGHGESPFLAVPVVEANTITPSSRKKIKAGA